MSSPFARVIAAHPDAGSLKVQLAASVLAASKEWQRLADMEQALHGLVGLVQFLSHNEDMPMHVKEAMVLSHRYLEALRVIGEPVPQFNGAVSSVKKVEGGRDG